MIRKVKKAFRISAPGPMTIRNGVRERPHKFPRIRNAWHKLLRALGLLCFAVCAHSAASGNISLNGVKRITAGSNITISPTTGVGNVTITASGGGGETNTYGTDGSSKTFAGALGVAGNLLAGSRVVVSTTVSGNGNLRVRAGTGNGGGTTPIILYQASLSSTTGSTAATSWISGALFTVPANTLVSDGDRIDVFCIAKATTTSLTKGVEVTINGQQTALGATTATDTNWEGMVSIWRQSATNLSYRGKRFRSAAFVSDSDYTVATTLSSDFTVSCDIRAASGAYPSGAGDENMELKHMSVTLYPAP